MKPPPSMRRSPASGSAAVAGDVGSRSGVEHGIGPSLYNSFGNKHDLFPQALELP
jgi:hypothetical protein